MENLESLLAAIRLASCAGADPTARHAGWLAARQLAAELAPTAATATAAPHEPVYLRDGAMTGAPSAASAIAPSEHPPVAPPPVAPPPVAPPPESPLVEPPTPAPAGPPPPQAGAGPIDPALVAQVLSSLRTLPPEQLLDVAIAKLRAALPAGATVAPAAPVRFHLVPLHHLERLK